MLYGKIISKTGIDCAVLENHFQLESPLLYSNVNSNCVFWSQIPANLLQCPEHEAENGGNRM